MAKDNDPLLLLDACTVINLAAALPLEDLSTLLGRPVGMVRQASEEVLFLHDDVEGETVKSPVDTARLQIVEMLDAELEVYVRLAAFVDDGEAATLAVAHSRNLGVATDDRAAIRLVSGARLSVQLFGTSALLRSWADRNAVSREETARALRQVKLRARFVPRADDPNCTWWRDHISS